MSDWSPEAITDLVPEEPIANLMRLKGSVVADATAKAILEPITGNDVEFLPVVQKL